MKKIIYIALIFVAGLLAFFFFGKQMIIKENTNKPTLELTVFTVSSSDTEKWHKVKEVESEEATYFITVKEVASSEEVFSNIIANGAAMGFGVREEEVKQFNNKRIISFPISPSKAPLGSSAKIILRGFINILAIATR